MKIRSTALTNLLLLLLFLLPIQSRWIISRSPLGTGTSEYGAISIYGVEALLWVTFALFILSGRLKLPKAGGGRRALLALTAFSTYAFFSIFAAPDYARGFFSWIHLLDGVLLFALFAWGGVKNRWLLYSFIAGMLVQAGLGIVQFSFQGISPSTLFGIAQHDPAFLGDAVVETATGRWLRAYGGLPHPNILGGYLAVALIFLGTIIIWRKSNQKKDTLALFVLLAISAALFFTFSRGAMIAAGVGGLMFLWNAFLRNGDERFHRILKFGLPLALLWIVIGLTFVPLFQTRFTSLGRLEAKSNNERVTEYKRAFEFLPRFALKGAGIGAYTKRLAELRPGLPGYAYQPVHNTYLLLAVELGVTALALFLSFLLIFISALHKKERFAAYPPLITLLILGFFDHYLWSLPAGQFLFWATLGLLSNFRADEV